MRCTLFLVALLVVAACDRTHAGSPEIQSKQEYSLCPKNKESRPRLLQIFKEFAANNDATITDRGAEAQLELSGMENKGALRSTGGDLVVLTVEKPNDLRISLSNLGLLEKFAMAVRGQKAGQQDRRVSALMAAIDQSWIVQRLDDGVGNDPPCSH
jgi:hypothetical protein